MKEVYKCLWNIFYKDGTYVMRWPDEPTIRFFGRLSKRMSLKGKKGLDMGCGVGRNLWLMHEFGIEPYGIEISKEAVKKAVEFSKQKFPSAKIVLYDGQKIPFDDEYFDFVISHGVLDHMTFNEAKLLINEIYRVLKPLGCLCLVVHSIYDSEYGKGKKIEENTFLIEEGDYEVGLPQHYFTFDELNDLLNEFQIEQIYRHEEIFLDKYYENPIKTSSFWVVYAKKKGDK